MAEVVLVAQAEAAVAVLVAQAGAGHRVQALAGLPVAHQSAAPAPSVHLARAQPAQVVKALTAFRPARRIPLVSTCRRRSVRSG